LGDCSCCLSWTKSELFSKKIPTPTFDNFRSGAAEFLPLAPFFRRALAWAGEFFGDNSANRKTLYCKVFLPRVCHSFAISNLIKRINIKHLIYSRADQALTTRSLFRSTHLSAICARVLMTRCTHSYKVSQSIWTIRI